MTPFRHMKLSLALSLMALLFTPFVLADGDYTFRDVDGNTIVVPKNIPLHSEENPGALKDQIQRHTPTIKSKSRKEGLELIRFVELTIPHPNKDSNPIKAVYIADKDGLIVGYKPFSPREKILKGEFRLNGVINYIVVYVECSEHELWKKSFRI